jgi:hypothetical protein
MCLIELVQEEGVDSLMDHLELRLKANPNLSVHTPAEILGKVIL